MWWDKDEKYNIEMELTTKERKKLLDLLIRTPTFLALADKMQQGTEMVPNGDPLTAKKMQQGTKLEGPIEKMYDAFFGKGDWEEKYKEHIVIFAKKCVEFWSET